MNLILRFCAEVFVIVTSADPDVLSIKTDVSAGTVAVKNALAANADEEAMHKLRKRNTNTNDLFIVLIPL